MKLPVIIINFKTYDQSTGLEADKLALICEEVAQETGKSIAVAVEEVDLHRISNLVSIPVLSEHMDVVFQGAHTGTNLPQALKDNGAIGVLINHSEDRLRMDLIKESIRIAGSIGLTSVVCANDANMAGAVAVFNPDIIAVEPPELIGTGISVSQTKPEVITDAIFKVSGVSDIPVICGAGINTSEDVKKALELGAKGVLIASGVIKSEDPKQVLSELASEL